ncbi:hypothetical protein [Microlunatus parietis]|uniref:Secreted protein n=1 Tax=Microlunatus parietis TaxID=682979 RepID=A0A7Y9LAX5_9ACTN|nr:hypothetical protein [Microlunatus parietis]NYE70228.1 hypothetical protein [Microlunatus parietis]
MTIHADHGAHGDHAAHAGHGPGGLTVSERGYTVRPDSVILAAGRQPITFRIIGPDGAPVTAFEPTHDKELHLIATRRDQTGFQHVHPTLDESGTWTVELDLTPGVWRYFADFKPAGHDQLTLGVDVSVAGEFDPQPLPPVQPTFRIDDYTVTLTGELQAGQPAELTLTVQRDGQPVTDLEPYLAAYGHLVALRAGDLAYLHVHPEGHPGDGSTPAGPDVVFVATAPSPGTYRLYLDFQHGGVVRTASFTVEAGRPHHHH